MSRQYNQKHKKTLKHTTQYGGRVFAEKNRERYEIIPGDEKREVLEYVISKVDPVDLVDEVIAWIDQNPGLRFDRFTMRELLDEYNQELQEIIAQRIQERLA